MSKLINADKLEPDTEWSDYYDDFVSYSQSQIDAMEEVKAIPLEKIKQAREKIEDKIQNYPDRNISEYEDCLAILDKLIEESEE